MGRGGMLVCCVDLDLETRGIARHVLDSKSKALPQPWPESTLRGVALRTYLCSAVYSDTRPSLYCRVTRP